MDDACRLALADAPLLLALSGLFTVPAACVSLLLLAQPQPVAWEARAVLPALAALLLPLTGLGSGACQDLLRRRAEGEPVALGGCLVRALRRGLDHAAAAAIVWAVLYPICVGLAWPAGNFVSLKSLVYLALATLLGIVPMVLGGPSVHAIIAGEGKNWFAAFQTSAPSRAGSRARSPPWFARGRYYC